MDERARIIEVFRKNLANLISERHLTQRDFAKMVGVSAPTVNDWLKGKTSPRMNKIDKICNIFTIKRSDLLDPPRDTESAPPPPPASSQPYRAELTERDECHGVKIPVLGRVVAGLPAYASEEIIDYEEIPEEMARSGEYFGLIVRGLSMLPTLRDGDVVIVKKQEDIDSGDIAIVGINGDEATVKEVKKDRTGITLIGHNEAVFPPRHCSNKEIEQLPVTIYGKVVELRRKF